MKKGTLVFYIALASAVNAAFLAFFVLVLCLGNEQPYLALFITFLMLAYHLNVRLFIGAFADLFKNRIDVDKPRHRISEDEFKRLETLKVKKWKKLFPALSPEQFALDESNEVGSIIRSCINAERIHWLCFFLGLGAIPLGCAVSLSEWWLYLTISLLASLLIELPLILIQRYNRYRLYRLKDRIDKRKERSGGTL